MKILLAVDGSPTSARAVAHAVKLMRQLPTAQLTLLHADPPLMQAVVTKIGAEAATRYHLENGRYATRSARAALKRARIAHDEALVVGDPAASIVREAKKGRYELIVMGSHGRGALQGLLLGSVASKVIAQADVPVTVVR